LLEPLGLAHTFIGMTHDDHIDRHRGWIAGLLVALGAALDQSFHLLALFLTALLIGVGISAASTPPTRPSCTTL